MATYQTVPVVPILAPYIREIAIQPESDDARTSEPRYTVYPTPFPVFGLQYRGRLSVIHGSDEQLLEPIGMTGLQATARRFRPDEGTRSVLVRFEPHGAHALLDCDMSEVADAHVGLGELLKPGAVRTLEAQAAEATTLAERSRIVQAFFVGLARQGRREPDPVVVEAIRQIIATRGQLRVEPLADHLGISARQLERLFRLQVGVGPKRYASLVQFDWARKRLAARVPAATVAAEAGYADQAHFTRAFLAGAGATPRRYLAASGQR